MFQFLPFYHLHKGNIMANSFQVRSVLARGTRRLPSLRPHPRYHRSPNLERPSRGKIRFTTTDSSTKVSLSNSADEEFHARNINEDVLPTTSFDNGRSQSILFRDLNPNQIEAVAQPEDAITRVVAGPGSGKTRVLTCRIAYLLQQPGSKHRVLGVTFTRKAAGEMQERLEKLLVESSSSSPSSYRSSYPEDGSIVEDAFGGGSSPYPRGMDRVTLGTFHSICAKILRWNGERLRHLPSVDRDMSGSQNATLLDGNFVIVPQAGQLQVLKECLKDADIDLKYYDLKPLPLLTTIGKCKAKLAQGVDPFFPPKSKKPLPKAVQVAHKVYRRYREKLLSTNCIDFDDLIFMARELLLQNPDVREHLQRRWTHVLVDEFQDTSRSQMDIVKLLTSRSLFVVGDADQSIYSWRGAHAESLSDFEDEFRNEFGDVSTVYLMENYRSTSNIVEAAQKVISRRNGGETSSSGADDLRRNMKPKRGAGPSPRVIACKDDKAEGMFLVGRLSRFFSYADIFTLSTIAEFVIKTIKDRVVSGEYGPSNTVALVYRTNAQSRSLEDACVKQNLPYVIFGSATSFYKRHEIKDCLCFLRWLHNGRDRTSMLRAMVTPKRGIGETAIREFDAYCAHVESLVRETSRVQLPTPFEVLLSLSGETATVPADADARVHMSSRALKLLTEFSGQMRAIGDIGLHQNVEQLLSAIINDLKLIPHLDKISKSKVEFEERKRNVEELRQAAHRYNRKGRCLVAPEPTDDNLDEEQSPLGAFLDDISLVTDMMEDTKTSTENRFVANLMTIHASKGMEFDAVFVVGNEDGTLPTSQVSRFVLYTPFNAPG